MAIGPSAHELALASEQSYNECSVSSGDTQVLVIEKDDYVIVAPRGTEKDWGDWVTDMRGIPWYISEIDAWCHSGFAKAIRGGFFCGRGIWPLLKMHPALNSGKPIYLTGHSLGGALAVMIYVIILAENKRPNASIRHVYPPVTFGAPKLGWLKGKVGSDPMTRYVFGDDVVPSIPRFLFGHEGVLVPIGIASTERMGMFKDHRISGHVNALAA